MAIIKIKFTSNFIYLQQFEDTLKALLILTGNPMATTDQTNSGLFLNLMAVAGKLASKKYTVL